MQMKMDQKQVHRFDKGAVRKQLEAEDEFISELLDSCEVPDEIEGINRNGLIGELSTLN